MGYPTDLLDDDESIEFELRPHWRSMIIATFWLLVIIAVASFLLAITGRWLSGSALTWLRVGIVSVAVGFAWVLFVRHLIVWLTTQYVFTNRRIIVRTGLIARKGRDMPLSKVNNVSFEHTVLERLFNCGTLTVESAAEQGSLVISNVPDVERVQREVYVLHDEDDEFRARRAESFRNPPPPGQ